ncbi:MAG TPA: tetratricopeptide repeat protein, partial [Candidatus Glassbacteria bacterium]|nr:tetratricopeptide repeat protein [Candidatus Glassbacteria bacterium]
LSNRNRLFAAAAIVLAVVAIYGQTLNFGYVNYDDGVIRNLGRLGYDVFSAEGLKKTFIPQNLATYQPLRQLATAFVYRFSGTSPFGYHLFNLVFYLLNLAALFYLLKGLLRAYYPGKERETESWAWLGTALFAVHPVHVEAVAWMNSNKELLASLCYFLSLSSYLKSREGSPFRPAYIASWLFFGLALLAKPSVAALPLVVLALELTLPDGRLSVRTILRVLPFVAAAGAVAFYFTFRATTTAGSYLQGSLLVHGLTMTAVLAKYVIHLLLPVNLCHSYPPPYFSGHYDWRLALYLGLDLALPAAAFIAWRRGNRGLVFAILFFLLNLLPVSGLVPIRIFMADRYVYLSSVGFIMAAVIVLSVLYERSESSGTGAGLYRSLVAAVLVLLSVMAFGRCRAWKDGITLWSSAVTTHPNYQYNHFGLGDSFFLAGRYDRALEAFQQANRFQENFSCDYYIAKSYDQLGDSLAAERYYHRVVGLFSEDMTNQLDVMIDVYGRLGLKEELVQSLYDWGRYMGNRRGAAGMAVRRLEGLGRGDLARQLAETAGIAPVKSGGRYTRLAESYLARGQLDSAATALEEASRRSEDPRVIRPVSGDLYFAQGDWQRAAQRYRQAGESLSPSRREKLAAAFLHDGRPDSALAVFRSLAEQSTRNKAFLLNNIGVVLEAMDSLAAAESHYRQALSLKQDYTDAWFNLSSVLLKKNESGPALECLDRVRVIEGASVELARRRAILLAAAGRRAEALEAWKEAVSLSNNDPAILLESADSAWEMGHRELARHYYGILKN